MSAYKDHVLRFRNRLTQINTEVLSAPIPNLSGEMAEMTQRLRTEFGDISRYMNDQRGIAIAVINFLETKKLETYQSIKYVCFGISSPYGSSSALVIEDKALFSLLLEEVKRLEDEPRKFRRCYQGLLKGYLRYSGNDEKKLGHKNWLALRGFLDRNLLSLKKQKPLIEWVQSLYEHRNLLTQTPCEPYAKALLAGDSTIVDELQNKLGIDDDTWVMNELVLAHIRGATELIDTEYVSQVTPLVELLKKHSGLITNGLILILKRYVKCKEHAEHHILCDTLLHEWKSPWLEANISVWHGLVGIEATQMVRLWLTKQHIKDFFELLQSGGQADKQRMEFWLGYAESIDDFWLALGTNSFYNQGVDFKRIRMQMEGHCMRLSDSNQNNDNAFLMKIGQFVYIEFGKQGNACHIFSADNLPFTVGQSTVSGTGSGLKDRRHPGWQIKLSHYDGWQKEFSKVLENYSGAIPNKKIKLTTTPKQVLNVESRKVDYSVGRKFSDDKIKYIHSLCGKFDCKVEDKRRKGGAFWVIAHLKAPISEHLLALGLQYKEGKGWWCE